MAVAIELNKDNLRKIRKDYFHFTLEGVERITGISATTIRNAEIGRNVSDSIIDKLLSFYMHAEHCKRFLKAKNGSV